MNAPLGLFLFSVPLILCTIFARPLYEDHIERDLGNKVREILTKHDLDPSGIVVERHHLRAIGAQPRTEAEKDELLSELDGVIGLYVDAKIVCAPRVLSHPHFHFAERADGSVVLEGLIGSEDERDFLVGLATSPRKEGGEAREVVDQLKLQDRVSSLGEGVQKRLATLAPALLATSEKATLHWTPTTLKIGGMVEGDKQESALIARAGELPDTVNFQSELSVEPRQHTDFGFERSNRGITVTGVLPDSETQDRLVNLIRRESRGARIFDQTTLVPRAHPAWWNGNPAAFLPHLLPKTQGRAKVHYYHDRFIAEATFDEREDYDVVKAELANFPQEATQSTDLRIVRKADAPSRPVGRNNPIKAGALISKLQKMAVYFDSSSSTVKEDETQKIIDAAKLILRSKDVTQGLTVGGYADLRGNKSFNRRLSLKRAKAVRDQLIEKGVPAERLSVKHFGEDTSKTAKKDLWKSRRVEISLTKEAKKPEKSAK